jgi:hypothetical protein
MTLRATMGITVKVTTIASGLFGLVMAGVVFSDDPLSAGMRPRAEVVINGFLASMQKRAATGKLTIIDRVILHLGVTGGIVIGEFISPEGAAILCHAVYGDGGDLQLDPSYFKHSKFLAMQIERRSPGNHGPIVFQQSEDTRLSLAFNPMFITISDRSVRIGHPHIKFAAPDAPPVPTVIPVGKLRLRMFDNLVGALQTKAFAAYAEWRLE